MYWRRSTSSLVVSTGAQVVTSTGSVAAEDSTGASSVVVHITGAAATTGPKPVATPTTSRPSRQGADHSVVDPKSSTRLSAN